MSPESMIRVSVFIGMLSALALWEIASPRRRLRMRKSIRWASNLSLTALNTVAMPLLVPIMAMGAAAIAAENGWGLFNVLGAPYWVGFLLSVAALDLIIYLQHVMFHSVPVLWRLHRVHHSDVDLDVTSATRFHILEMLISMGIKIAAVTCLGAPVMAVLVFEIILNATAMFNHANIKIPVTVDRVLRMVLVTPDMHRIHHSVHRDESDTNFGFNVPWWDFIFGTYRDQPKDGQEDMTLGVKVFRDEREAYLDKLITQPFRSGQVDDQPETDAAPSNGAHGVPS